MIPDTTISVWKALADPTRRKILDLLKQEALNTQDICSEFKTSRFAIMKHLTVLENAGLILVRREGRMRWNHLNVIPLQEIYQRWVSEYAGGWAKILSNLKSDLDAKEEAAVSELKAILIEQEFKFNAPVSNVFQAITENVADWWGAPYQLTPEPTSLLIEPKAGGRFFEEWEQGSALWGVVQSIRQDDHIVFEGSFGMLGAINGVVTFIVEPADGGTLLKFSHRAIGEVTDDHKKSYAAGWQDLLGVRLKAFAEQGIKYGLGHEPPIF